MVGFILSWCGLLLEWVVRIYLSRSDLAKVLIAFKYCELCICRWSVWCG